MGEESIWAAANPDRASSKDVGNLERIPALNTINDDLIIEKG